MQGSLERSARTGISEALARDSRPGNDSPKFSLPSWGWLRQGVALLVAALTLASAWLVYGHYFLSVDRHLWYSALHDRNAHYAFGLNIATDIRNGDVSHLRHVLDGAGVWGILHGLLLAGFQLFDLGNRHLAVWPSLIGWMMSVVFGFLAARRMVWRGGTVAGVVAALLILVSPAHRAFATDVMLESLGAGLSLLALYFYLRTVQGPRPWSGRGLALALTALFFLKTNYWMLVLLGLAAGEFTRQPRFYGQVAFHQLWNRIPWRQWLRAQVRNPLNYLAALPLGLAVWIGVTGGVAFRLFGQEFNLRTPINAILAVYVIFFVRVSWWLRQHAALVAELPPGVRHLTTWHVLPVSLWFLLPKKLGLFLWYMSLNNAASKQAQYLESLTIYARQAIQDYHLGVASAGLVAVLVAVAFLGRKALKPGGTAVLWFVLLAALLTVVHPNRNSRFLHSWIAGSWLAAGAGLAICTRHWLTARWGNLQHAVALGAVAIVAGAHSPGLLQPGHAPEGGPRPDLPSTLDVTDAYLPSLRDCRRTAFLSPLPLKFMANWSFLEHYPDTRRVVTELEGFTEEPGDQRDFLKTWLEKTTCDAVVYIDIPKESCFCGHPYYDFSPLPELIAGRQDFVLAKHWDFPQYHCAVSFWTRRPAGAGE